VCPPAHRKRLCFGEQSDFDLSDEPRQTTYVCANRVATKNKCLDEGRPATHEGIQNQIAWLGERFDGRSSESRREASRVAIKGMSEPGHWSWVLDSFPEGSERSRIDAVIT
jgi:hypothetical protein